MERLGQGTEQAGENFFRTAEFQAQVAADDQSNKAQQRITHLLHGDPNKIGPDGNPDTGFFGLQGEAALHGRAEAEKQMDEIIKEARSGLTPRAQLQFDSFIRRYRTNESEKIGTFSNQQYKSYVAQTNTASAKLATDAIARNADNPFEVQAHTADLIHALTKNVQLHGGGPEQMAEAEAAGMQIGVKTWLDQIATNDAPRALNMLEKNREIAGAQYDNMFASYRARADQQEGIADANVKMGLVHAPEAPDFFRARGGARIEGVSPVFANRLRAAIEAAEAATGEKARIESLKRTSEEQARLYDLHLRGGPLAAPPGKSRHEFGEAADIHDGKVLNWLHQHAGEYGLEFLKGKAFEKDSGHVQLAGGVGASSVGGISPLPPKGDVMMKIITDPEYIRRPQMQAAALAQVSRVYSAAHDSKVQDLAAFKQQVEDSTAEALRTGTVQTPLTEEDFTSRRGPEQGAIDYRSYLADVQYGVMAKALETMPYTEQVKLLEQAAPTPGEGFADQADRQDRLQKVIKDIDAKRRDDPAGAIANSPVVKAAYAGYKPDNPETFKPVAAARLAAQEALGIDPEYRSPITKQEALRLTAPLRTMLPGQEKQTLEGIIDHFQKMFGDSAPQAFAYALRAHKVDVETAQIAARLMKKLSLGQAVQPEEAAELDTAKETAAADRAIRGDSARRSAIGDFGSIPQNIPFGEGGEYLNPTHEAEGPEVARVPPRAIEYLLRNPGTAAAFDKQFAQAGLAKRILEKYGTAVLSGEQ